MLLLIALVGFGAPSARAAAHGADPDRDPQVRAWLGAAASFWGASPGCTGGVGMVRAEWSPLPGAWAAAIPNGCWIALDPDFYPRPAALEATRWAAGMCAVVVHEWGHLLGFRHVPDAGSIMAPTVPLNLVGGCPSWPALPSAGVAVGEPAAPVAKKRRRTRKGRPARPLKGARPSAGTPAARVRRR